MITGYSQQTNKHFVLKLISFKSGQFQNNTVNDGISISINRVINSLKLLTLEAKFGNNPELITQNMDTGNF